MSRDGNGRGGEDPVRTDGGQYGLGVTGAGVIWDRGHWPALQEIDEITVEAVYDLDEERRAEVAAETGAAAVEDADAIFADDGIDVVTIATPPFARREYVEAATDAGKHLMLEKPVARTLEDTLAIHEAVEAAGVQCFVPFGRTASSAMAEVVDLVHSGELGEPRVFHHSSLGTPYEWVDLDHWMHDHERSGGPVFDYSIHAIDLGRACMGEAEAVSYDGRATTGRVAADDHATLSVYYEDDAFGEYTKSWAYPPGVEYRVEDTQVVCEDGVIVMGEALEVHTPDGVRTVDVEADRRSRAVGYRNLIGGIESGEALIADVSDGLRAIEILDAALDSRDAGERVPVELYRTA